MAGLRLTGVVAPVVLDGPINRAAFETYVEQVLVPELRPGDVVILDNLSSHKGPRVREMIDSGMADPHSDRGCRRRILPCLRGGYGTSSCERPGITTGTIARAISVLN